MYLVTFGWVKGHTDKAVNVVGGFTTFGLAVDAMNQDYEEFLDRVREQVGEQVNRINGYNTVNPYLHIASKDIEIMTTRGHRITARYEVSPIEEDTRMDFDSQIAL